MKLSYIQIEKIQKEIHEKAMNLEWEDAAKLCVENELFAQDLLNLGIIELPSVAIIAEDAMRLRLS